MVFVTIDAAQLDVGGKDGLTSQRRLAGMPFSTAMLAQVSPAIAVYQRPQLSVVPRAITLPFGGAVFSSIYPSDVPGSVVELAGVDVGGIKVPP